MKVIINSSNIIINELEVCDADIAAKLSGMRHDQIHEFLRLSLRAGFEVFRFAADRGETDWVKSEMQDLFRSFGKNFEDTILKENYKRYAELLNQDTLDKLKADLIEKIETSKQEILTQKEVGEAIELVLENTPVKGFGFEERVARDLEKFARGRFDTVEALGTSVGHGNSKVGDFIYRDGLTNGRIVLELKNYETSLSFPKIRNQIQESIHNRNAQFCLYIVNSTECLPEAVGEFFFEGNFIVTTYKYLEIALKFALVDIYRQSRAARTNSLNVEELNTELNQIVTLVGSMDKLSNGIRSTQKSLGKVESDLVSIKDDIHVRIKKLLSQIQAECENKSLTSKEVSNV